MLDGKMFFGVTGTPIRKIALVNKALADAEPVPLTFANLTTKSFIFIQIIPGPSQNLDRDGRV